jgi:hypothetical protein
VDATQSTQRHVELSQRNGLIRVVELTTFGMITPDEVAGVGLRSR